MIKYDKQSPAVHHEGNRSIQECDVKLSENEFQNSFEQFWKLFCSVSFQLYGQF